MSKYGDMPSPSRIPIEDAGLSEVLIRVAFRAVQIDLRRNVHQYSPDPTYGLRGLASRLEEAEFGAIAGYVRNMSWSYRNGMTVREHKNAVIRASRDAKEKRRWQG